MHSTSKPIDNNVAAIVQSHKAGITAVNTTLKRDALQKVARHAVRPFHHWVFFFTYLSPNDLNHVKLSHHFVNHRVRGRNPRRLSVLKKKIQRARCQQSERFTSVNLFSSMLDINPSFSPKIPEWTYWSRASSVGSPDQIILRTAEFSSDGPCPS